MRVPGLRLWRDRLNRKIEATPEGAYRRFLCDERDELATLISGLLSIGGDPDA